MEIPKLPQTVCLADKVKSVEESLAYLRRKKRGFAVSSFSGISRRKDEKYSTETVGGAVKSYPVEIKGQRVS
ncbi:MAG: hypothetical protein CM1200mP30_34210 [Pseudomonadota bacterium]|nr:MAG: hypothetical protein CM1200mP30_34210 [Pseudomonadota bacterium]